ncbi:MAG: transcription termination/antitermination protein NusA [Deltaproteobacteria bacterium]|nr:transcription termination/antitermination protein NusA [Deltaproteobacteria bacterium]MBP6831930.1 transcription termination/antitermination protein NusA [Deltaproteobacteria bacterium]
MAAKQQAPQPPAQQTLNLSMTLDAVAKDKGIERSVLVLTLESAILSAARKHLGGTRELVARYSERDGAVDLYQHMTVVDTVSQPDQEISLDVARKMDPDAQVGEQLAFQVFYRAEDERKAAEQEAKWGDVLNLSTLRKGFGRIAAQAAKQVIIQRVRDAERELVFNEYISRKGEIITGIFRRFERNDIIVDLGRTEAILRAKDQVPRESYRPGERIVAFVKDIDREAKGPQVLLSRGDVGLLIKLFEAEVPEIYEGIVKIVAAAREPGVRSKIAVSSRDLDVDPVGACVGVKGSRVQAVVQELRGERIDIVPYDRDPARYVCNAIAPAEISRVLVNEADHAMELVVSDEKLSLAIGRKGQNVRLASQLTGWKLDIISESKFKQMEEESINALSLIPGVTPSIAQTMYKLGFRSLEEVAEASTDELAGIPGLGGAENADRIKSSAETAMEELRQRRIREASRRTEPLSERERLLFVRGVGEHTINLLMSAGVSTVEQLHNTHEDSLLRDTGLGLRKVRQIKLGAQTFLSSEQKVIEEARKALRAENAERGDSVEG